MARQASNRLGTHVVGHHNFNRTNDNPHSGMGALSHGSCTQVAGSQTRRSTRPPRRPPGGATRSCAAAPSMDEGSRWTGGSGQRHSRVAGPPKGSDGRRARVQRTYAVWQCQASRLASRDTLSHSLNDILASLANMVSQKPKLQHTWRYQCPM